MDALLLHATLSALAPISGVSIGLVDDPTTWLVNFSANATADQRAAVAAYLRGKTAADFAPRPAERRCQRYQRETDPTLLAIAAYDVELELAPDKATKDAINAKRAPLLQAWAAAKTQIRKDIP